MRSFVFLLATLSLAHPAGAAVSTTANLPAVRSVVINGEVCSEVTEWSGGDLTATVVEAAPANGSIKKHVSNITIDPIVIKAALPLSAGLSGCLSDLCAGRTNPVTMLLFGSEPQPRQASNTVLLEARFPGLNASAKDIYEITLVFGAETVRPAAGAIRPVAQTARSSRTLASNFTVAIGTVDASRVVSIEPFVISRSVGTDAIGALRDPAIAVGPTRFSNITIVTNNASVASWRTWRDDFLINGNHLEANEIEGALTLLAPDMKTPQLVLQLHHVGLIRLADIPASGTTIARSAANLYCEQITVAPAGTVRAATPSASPPAPATPTPATTNPAATSPATAATPEPPPAAMPAREAGLRDPAGFPRPDGLVRTSYSKTDYETQLRETANYSSVRTVDAVLESYLKVLAGDGWKKESINETGSSPSDQMVLSNWSKGRSQVDLRLYGAKSGSTVSVTVTTNR